MTSIDEIKIKMRLASLDKINKVCEAIANETELKIKQVEENFEKYSKEIIENEWTYYIENIDGPAVAFRTKSKTKGYINDHFTKEEYTVLKYIFNAVGLESSGEVEECTYGINKKDVKKWKKALSDLGLIAGKPAWK